MKFSELHPNRKCCWCGDELYRDVDEIKASKSGTFFCNYTCKNHYQTGLSKAEYDQLHELADTLGVTILRVSKAKIARGDQ